ncbi:hypothetical protein [Haloarcula litorea]|uniref:DUF7857 domain-containing protein n=1 Tax=Haloarcula litorea TaxID=3032579 RepID=UPI0023E7F419|nr:hypothetical protein [Halomicroarcula sp. GDY20]
MVTLDCATSRHDGVTLVTVRLRDVDRPTRVTVRNRLDGPVWPPRREGRPATGWTDEGFEGVVESERALGYATPAPAETPAATLADATPVAAEGGVADYGRDAMSTDPDAVVRSLGDPSPPRDAVPRSGRDGGTDGGTSGRDAPETHDAPPADVPAPVAEWLATMADRADRAEALVAAETLAAATDAVDAAGGLAGVRDLATGTDERLLRAVARRAETLADRRAAASVPVETLERLA